MTIMHKFFLTNLPQFLRFDRIQFEYQDSAAEALPIAEKCQSVLNCLQPLKLDDPSLIHFIGAINKNDRNCFSDHSQLLDHLRNELLPICGSSHRYEFEICLDSYEVSVSSKNLIAQILQLPQIECCLYVEIKLYGHMMYLMQFPIDSISSWLHRNCDGIEEKSKERFLKIYFSNSNFPFARELCDHLTKVTF